jgi:signal transduction histidine kinase/ABC-type amino acid transport substrate-binding protein
MDSLTITILADGMKSKRLRYVVALAVMLILCCFATIGATAGDTAAVRQRYKVIRMYTTYDFPPYEFLDGDGMAKGYCVDVMREVMKKVNIPYTLTLTSWHEVLKAYDEGKVDIIVGMSYSEARAKKFHFGLNYAWLYEAVIYRRGDGQYQDLRNLKGKKVLVNKDDILEDVAHNAGLDKEIVPMTNTAEGLIQLSEGQVDALLCSREVAQYLINRNNIHNLEFGSLPLAPMRYGYSGRDPQLIEVLNDAWLQVKKGGIADEYYQKWFYNDSSGEIWKIIFICVICLFVVSGALFVFIYILRKKVEKAKRIISMQSKYMALSLKAGGVAVWKYDVQKKLFFDVEGKYFKPEGSRIEDILKHVHPDDREIYADVIEKVSEGENDNNRVLIRMDKELDGHYRYIENEFALICDDAGKVQTVVGSFRDVTEMTAMQKRDKENVDKMRFIINASGLILWDLDSKTLNFRCYNEKLFDNSKVWNLEDMYKYVHPDDEAEVRENMELLRSGENRSLSFDLRVKGTGKDGWRNCNITCIPFVFDNNGNVTKYVGFRRDNTDVLRKAEELRLFSEKMNYVLKSSDTIIWEYDLKTHLITLYDELNSVVEVISNQEYFERLTGKDREEAEELYSRMDKGLVDTFSNIRQVNHTTYGEGVRYALFNGLPLRDKDNNVVSYFGLRRDVTDMIETQHKLEDETEKAQVADKLKSAFLANMSHEIRTPLNAIVGFSNLLPDVDDEEERAKYVQIINTNNDLLLNLIDDILYLSKIESGVMEIRNDEFDLAKTFGIVYSSMKQRCTNPDVELLGEQPYGKCVIESDRNRMVQMLTNFTTNALKNTKKGHVKLGYKCDETGVTLYVEDTGVGIPKDKIGKIFNRFEKLDDFVQGTGLGLSICRAISDSWNGKIWVESEFGTGSTFYAWIPCKVLEVK